MKFLIDLPGPYAEGYKLLAKKLGYPTRQALVKYVLETAMNQYPYLLEEAAVESGVKEGVRKDKDISELKWEPTLPQPSDDVMKDIFGDDYDLAGETNN